MTPLDQFLKDSRNRMWTAHHEINALAQDKRKWTMSIPVRDDDSDMKLQAPLDDQERFEKLVRVAVEALKKFKEVEDTFERNRMVILPENKWATNALTKMNKIAGQK